MCDKRCTLRRGIKVISLPPLKWARLDACIAAEVVALSNDGMSPLACCCGHGVYHKTIVLFDGGGWARELFTGLEIPRRVRFYKRDAAGLFYIPEVEEYYTSTKCTIS